MPTLRAFKVRDYDPKLTSFKCYDDGDFPYHSLYLFGDEHGPTLLIRAMSFEDAWYIAVDESPTVPLEEVWECYRDPRKPSYDVFNSRQCFENYIAECDENEKDGPELLEGHEYQSNFTGSGIVDLGFYAWLEKATPERLEHFGIKVWNGHELTLLDDGTLDTVIEWTCPICGTSEEVRFSDIDRNDYGDITEDGWEDIRSQLEDEPCSCPEVL